MARVPLVDPATATGAVGEALRLQQERRGYALNISRALANLPPLAQGVNGLAGYLLRDSPLDPVLRELAILTVGRLTNSAYEFEHHVEIARNAGISAEQVEALPQWASSSLFDDCKRAVMRYAWQATERVHVADTVVDGVRRFLDDEQFMALVATVACYNMVARILEPLQVELEPEFDEQRAGGAG